MTAELGSPPSLPSDGCDGGCIHQKYGLLTLDECIVENCEVADSGATGGGIASDADLILLSSIIRGNVSPNRGGGIKVGHAELGSLVMNSSLVTNNTCFSWWPRTLSNSRAAATFRSG